MEFERAIFRVYERSMEGLLLEEERASEEPSNVLIATLKRPCLLVQLCTLLTGLVLLSSLVVLHVSFVGSAGCLPRELLVFNASSNSSSVRAFAEDEVLFIRVSRRLLVNSGSSLRAATDDDEAALTPMSSSSSALSSVRVRETESLSRSLRQGLLAFNADYQPYLSLTNDHRHASEVYDDDNISIYNNNNNNNNNSNSTITDTATNASDFHAFDFDYQVTFSAAVTLLDQRTRHAHNFTAYNVTLGEGECFGNALSRSLLPLGGLDVAILNNVMQTVRRGGIMVTRRGDVFRWHSSQIASHGGSSLSLFWENFPLWLRNKLTIAINSCLAFFLLSTTTALLVRVLISSGVVLIFPVLYLLQLLGLPAVNMRIISLSYPWIGLPLQLIRLRNQPVAPFLLAHCTRVLLYYLMYVGAQNLYLQLLYASSSTSFGVDQVWLYAVLMMWEYFSMLYVRSASSITLFPRASLAMFLVYHFYYYSFPGGFHMLALTSMMFLLLALMIFCVRVFELKAYRQGIVNIDQTRMLYAALPWPSWRADLAPEYTLFMPLTHRSSSVYQSNVPPPPGAESDAPPSQTSPNAETAGAGNIELGNMRPAETAGGTATNDIPPSADTSTPLSFISRLFATTNYQSFVGRNRPPTGRGEYSTVNSDSVHG